MLLCYQYFDFFKQFLLENDLRPSELSDHCKKNAGANGTVEIGTNVRLDPDVRLAPDVLWETKRLRSIVLRAHQYEQSAYGGTCGSLLVLNALRRELEGGAGGGRAGAAG
jgi:hypothetical protein